MVSVASIHMLGDKFDFGALLVSGSGLGAFMTGRAKAILFCTFSLRVLRLTALLR